MAEAFRNIVRFVCDDDGLAVRLSLEGAFELSAGVKPNVLSAVVFYDDFDQLVADDEFDGHTIPGTVARTGTLEFWWNTVPGGTFQPGFRFAGMSIVDAEPLEVGLPARGGSRRVISYRLFIADARHRLISPRGGNLRIGWINQRETEKGEAPKELKSNSWLIGVCLDLMGYPIARRSIDPAVDQRPAVRDLKWWGNHAPTELAKILDQVGAAFCLQSDGKVRIDMIGSGPLPSVPADQRLAPDLTLPGVERLGRTVVFSSHPNAIVSTRTLTGPNEETWEFVAVEDGQWKRLDELDGLNGATPQETVRNNFVDVPDEYRPLWRSQFYRFIRLSQRRYPVSLLGQVMKHGRRRKMEVRAKNAVKNEDGTWSNSDDFVQCTATFLHKDNTTDFRVRIIQVNELLGRIEGEAAGSSLEASRQFVELEDGQLEVTFSYEEFETVTTGGTDGGGASEVAADKDGRPLKEGEPTVPRYYQVGFTRSFGQSAPTKLSASDLRNALADPSTVVIPMPDWVLYRENGVVENQADLEGQAERLATRYLKGSGSTPKMVTAMGFCQAELSGRVSSVKIEQAEPRTTITLNGWFLPIQGRRLDDWKKEFEASLAHPGQATQQGERSTAGVAGSTAAVTPVMPAPAPPAEAASNAFPAQLTASGGGVYAWTEVEPLTDGTWRAKANGRTGTLAEGAAREITGRRGFETSATIGARTGTRVMLTQGLDPVAKTPVYTFEKGRVEFDVRILGSTKDGTKWRWAYTWVEMRKATAGFDGWQEQSGGRQGTEGRNKIERMNSTTGTTGVGVVTSTNGISGTTSIALKPAPTGVDVTMFVVELDDGTVEYHFEYTGTFDGNC